MEGSEDVLFALEVVVEGGLGDAQLLGDLPQAGAVVALGHEEVEGDIENALAGGVGIVRQGPALGPGGLGELGREGVVAVGSAGVAGSWSFVPGCAVWVIYFLFSLLDGR